MQRSVSITSNPRRVSQGLGQVGRCSSHDATVPNATVQPNWQRRVVSLFYRLVLCGAAASSLMITAPAVLIHENYVIHAMNGGELSPARGLAYMVLGTVPLVIQGAIFWLARKTCQALDRETFGASRSENTPCVQESGYSSHCYKITTATDRKENSVTHVEQIKRGGVAAADAEKPGTVLQEVSLLGRHTAHGPHAPNAACF